MKLNNIQMDKNIKNKILSAVKAGIQNALNESASNITREEILNDINTMKNFPDNDEKKAIAAKYNIDSKKGKDIIDGITKFAQQIRKNQTVFNDADVKLFYELYTETPVKQLNELFANESVEFLKYLRDYYFNILVKEHLDKYANAKVKSRDFSYILNNSNKWKILRYQEVNNYLYSISGENLKKEDNTNKIYDKLQEQMVEFKELFIEAVCTKAKEDYKKIPSLIEKLTENKEALEDKIEAYNTENRGKLNWREIYYNTKDDNDLVKKISDKIKRYTTILKMYPSESVYVEHIKKNAIDDFNANTKALAQRINEKHIDVDNMEISEVQHDPKFFEMMISDGTQKFYARSILAAEFSSKMIPHFRFIITDRSKF